MRRCCAIASSSEFPQPQRARWQPWSPQAPTAGQQSSLQKLGAQRKLRHRNGEWGMGSYAKPGERKWQKQVSEWVSERVRKIKMEATTRNDGNALRFQGKPATAAATAATAVCQSHAQSVSQSINQSIKQSSDQSTIELRARTASSSVTAAKFVIRLWNANLGKQQTNNRNDK